MKKLFSVLFFLTSFCSIGQLSNWDKICINDTLKISNETGNSFNYIKTNCQSPSKFGYRFDLGASYFDTHTQVQNWIGKPIHLTLGFILSY